MSIAYFILANLKPAVVLVNSSIWWLILIHRHSKSYPKYKSWHPMTSYFYEFISCAFSQKTTRKQNRYLIPVLLLIWEKLIHLHNYSSNGSSFLSECTAQSLSVTMAFPNGSNIDVSYGQKRLNLTLTLSSTRTPVRGMWTMWSSLVPTRELHIVMVFLLLCHVLWSRRNIFSSSFVSRRPSSQHSLLSYSCPIHNPSIFSLSILYSYFHRNSYLTRF